MNKKEDTLSNSEKVLNEMHTLILKFTTSQNMKEMHGAEGLTSVND